MTHETQRKPRQFCKHRHVPREPAAPPFGVPPLFPLSELLCPCFFVAPDIVHAAADFLTLASRSRS